MTWPPGLWIELQEVRLLPGFRMLDIRRRGDVAESVDVEWIEDTIVGPRTIRQRIDFCGRLRPIGWVAS